MKIEASRCNWCKSIILRGEENPGTIRIDNLGLKIIGANKKTERYCEGLKSNNQQDFCSAKCFLHWLYTSKETANAKTIDYESPFYQMINDEVGIKKEN
jgi:hypothetical protein